MSRHPGAVLPRVLLALVASGCASPRRAATQPSPPSTRPAAAAPAPPDAPDSGAGLCLPLVSGCGCAYVCARSLRRVDARAHEVVHDLQDSRHDRATVERWCFDDAGHGAPERAASGPMHRCTDVFYDGTPCGGECIASPQNTRCEVIEGRCRPRP
ncbi:MAG: hypothetical protein WCJ30_00020 [Deltaproteobacteria bacterium]